MVSPVCAAITVPLKAAAQAITQFMGEIERQIGWATHAGVFTGAGALEQRQVDFIRLLRQAPAVTELTWLDPQGREQLKVSRHYALHMAALYPALPRHVARAHGGRLRVGYLSADFHQHATAQLMAQMLECHDRAEFEVTLLSAGPRDDSPMRRRLRAGSERFEELSGKSFEAMARRIRDVAQANQAAAA